MTYTHLWDLVISLVSLVTYIRLGGIMLLNPFFMTYTHLRDLVIFFITFKLLDLLALRHGLNNSFIAFQE